jgi:hypothetical protein
VAQPAIIVDGATRPCLGETENGDAWQVDWRDGACRIAVIDALGHGPGAAEVADQARLALLATHSLAPSESLGACHRALVGGRGAAISIVHISPDRDQLLFAGIGNVEAILWTAERERVLSPDRGIVGAASRTLHPIEVPLGERWLLIVYTDGISARFRTSDLFGTPGPDPGALAASLLDQWARPRDDATIVVASPNAALTASG